MTTYISHMAKLVCVAEKNQGFRIMNALKVEIDRVKGYHILQVTVKGTRNVVFPSNALSHVGLVFSTLLL